MKRRNWILQEISLKDQDYVTIERLVKRDALIECGSLAYAKDPVPYADSIPVGDIPFVESWLKSHYGKTMVPIHGPR
ncbi:hypothetical protein I5Q83_33305 [Enterocloster clostridioformis]|uniref:hypothetical protein n=1 Tax=Enterocloster clostridioformis TaxID=1531 RepID=UPI00080C6129|nr:hypothetical protein [Enterocloster clostridioformis]QQR00578.1 hypothetical protein I5Q83_33305 [Enterocloster clostridioformis]